MGPLRVCEMGETLRREIAWVDSSKALYNSLFSPFSKSVSRWGRALFPPSEPLQLPKWSPSASKFSGRYRPSATRVGVRKKLLEHFLGYFYPLLQGVTKY